MKRPDFAIVIPARHASTRLPGKPLRAIAGRPLIMHVWDCASASGATETWVATDDARIEQAVEAHGGRAMLTSTSHRSGTDRVAEVAESRGWAQDRIVVNLQGDEPLVPPALVHSLVDALAARPEADLATAATAIADPADLWSPHVVKVVMDREGYASYFSRAPIPWARDAFADSRSGPLPRDVPFLRHLGLYAYRVRTLLSITATEEAATERAEALEQLRALYMGARIHVSVISEAPPPGVDTEEDLQRVRSILERG